MQKQMISQRIKNIAVATALTGTLLSTGCASIVSDSSYPVSINSAPTDARFTIKDRNGNTISSGRTPMSVHLTTKGGYFSGENYTIEFTKPGFENQTYQLNSSLDGWYIGNFLFGGLIGLLIVDPITGAMWKLPKDASVSLSESLGYNDGSQGVRLISLSNVPDAYRPLLTEVPEVANEN
jgi:hypothetical protein